MLATILLVIVLTICMITDIKERKIYNVVIFPSLVISFMYHMINSGVSGLSGASIGFLVGLSLLLIPYFLGGIGAGDVKLLAFIGALKGTSFVLVTAIYMGILGAIMAIGILLFRKGAFKSLLYGIHSFRTGVRAPVFSGVFNKNYSIPYGVAIAGGAFLTLAFKGMISIW